MRVLRRGLLVLPALAFAEGAQAQLKLPATWYAVQVEDNVFTVQMPGIPDHRVVNDVSARGTAFAVHSYSIDAGGQSYVAQSALYPADVAVAQPRTILQSALADRAQRLEGGKWSQIDWRDIQGAPGAESIGPAKGGYAVRQLVLLKGRRFVSLAFLGPAAAVRGPEAERFFKSLRLLQ